MKKHVKKTDKSLREVAKLRNVLKIVHADLTNILYTLNQTIQLLDNIL